MKHFAGVKKIPNKKYSCDAKGSKRLNKKNSLIFCTGKTGGCDSAKGEERKRDVTRH